MKHAPDFSPVRSAWSLSGAGTASGFPAAFQVAAIAVLMRAAGVSLVTVTPGQRC
jgi:hypothetical protein